MILGVGTDLANIERIAGVLERHGDRFRNRVFTDTEQAKARQGAAKMKQAPMPSGGPQKKPAQKRWAQACVWALAGRIWPSAI